MDHRAYIFIDGDNTSYNELHGLSQLPKFCTVTIYYDQKHSKMFESNNMKKITKDKIADLHRVIVAEAKNSVDFRIISDVSVILQNKDVEYIYIVSADKGYDSVLGHLKKTYKDKRAIMRFESIEELQKDLLFFEMKTESDLKDALGAIFGGYRKELSMEILTNVFAYGLGK